MPTVFMVPDGGQGVILTDPEGWNLYTWVGDRPGMANCTGECAITWPPYLVEDEVVAPFGLPGNLGIVVRPEGGLQVAFDGWPLYYFTGDGRPGDAKGNEIVGFGYSWQVAAHPPRTPTSGQTPGVPVEPVEGPSPSFSAPPIPPGTAPSIIPITSPFTGAQPRQGAPSSAPPQPIGGQPLIPPGYAPTLTIIAPPTGIVGLTWVPTPTAAQFRIYQAPSSSPTSFTMGQMVNQPSGQVLTNGNVSHLVPGATYFLQVRAVDNGGIETVVPAVAASSPSLGR
jgi:predicted lipoprotein with Yx(FWY)xxD motif